MYNLNFCFDTNQYTIFIIVADVKPTQPEILICFELLYFIKIKILKAQSMYFENLKNEPWRGNNFIVRPRAQNCLATPPKQDKRFSHQKIKRKKNKNVKKRFFIKIIKNVKNVFTFMQSVHGNVSSEEQAYCNFEFNELKGHASYRSIFEFRYQLKAELDGHQGRRSVHRTTSRSLSS